MIASYPSFLHAFLLKEAVTGPSEIWGSKNGSFQARIMYDFAARLFRVVQLCHHCQREPKHSFEQAQVTLPACTWHSQKRSGPGLNVTMLCSATVAIH